MDKLRQFVDWGRPRRAYAHAAMLGLLGMAVIGGNPSVAHATTRPWTVGDYDGDGLTDITVYRPSTGEWWWLSSQTGGYTNQSWGGTQYTPVPGDYDGDGVTDYMVWQSNSGSWYLMSSSTGSQRNAADWGVNGDIPVPGDYDGDGITDIASWTPWTGTWWVSYSTGGSIQTAWGQEGDIPVPGDYDNDGKTDVSVFRPSNGYWYVISSRTGATTATQWGQVGDIPVAGDYDNDGYTDYAIYRPSTGEWWIDASLDGPWSVGWGTQNDIPVVGDYDGDGWADLTVFRPSEGNWYVLYNWPWTYSITQWGTGGTHGGGQGTDIPLPNLPRQAADELSVYLYPQQRSNWCWAASAEMIAGYYDDAYLSQCSLANESTGNTDCCTNAAHAQDPSVCNKAGSLYAALSRHNFTLTETAQLSCPNPECSKGVCKACTATRNAALSFAQLTAELTANRPVGFLWHWNGGGAHFQVAVGSWVDINGQQWVSVDNPLPVNTGTQLDLTYTDWVSSPGNYAHYADDYNIIRTIGGLANATL